MKYQTSILLIKKKLRRFVNSIKVKNKQKIFCIGRNKTGTTSLTRAFKDLGYVVGEQDVAEHLFEKYYLTGNYQPIIEYCKTAEVFQDVPFSFYEIIPHLDKAFPDSKFILTTRDTAEQWYQSFVKYYSKTVGVEGRPATYEELDTHHYVSKTFRKNFIVNAHGTTKAAPFDKQKLVSIYNQHNDFVKEYFESKPDKLLTLNIAKANEFGRLLKFLNRQSDKTDFSWENKT